MKAHYDTKQDLMADLGFVWSTDSCKWTKGDVTVEWDEFSRHTITTLKEKASRERWQTVEGSASNAELIQQLYGMVVMKDEGRAVAISEHSEVLLFKWLAGLDRKTQRREARRLLVTCCPFYSAEAREGLDCLAADGDDPILIRCPTNPAVMSQETKPLFGDEGMDRRWWVDSKPKPKQTIDFSSALSARGDGDK